MGHAIRSRVVLDELSRRHEVEVVVSGRAHGYLKSLESDRLGVNRIWGLSLVYEDNRVRNFRTLLANLKGALVEGGWPENIRAFFEIAERFRPDVVVSDFESWSYLFARLNGLPVISVDNQQIVARCELPAEVTEGHEAEAQLTRTIVKAKLPGLLPLRGHDLLLSARGEAPDHARAAHPAADGARGAARGGGAPARLPDLHERHGPARPPSRERRGVPDLRGPARAAGRGAGGEPALPSLLRPGVRRRPAHRARRGGQRRLHLAGGGRVPAPARALGPGAPPVRAGAQRPISGEGGLRELPPRR